MKASSRMFFLALVLELLVLSSCSTSPAGAESKVSYLTSDFPWLMTDYSNLDNQMGSLIPSNASTEPGFMHFQTFLLGLGLTRSLVDKLVALAQTNDFKFDRPVYHGIIHTARVANLTSSALSLQHGNLLSDEQKVLLTISAFLHDIDPARKRGTPPRVSSTFTWMDNDPQAKDVLHQIVQEKNISTDQIKSIIKYTDFDVDPKKLEVIISDADRMTEQNFGALAQTLKTWGRRIAYFDQVAMYVGSYKFATQSVVGLAYEFRKVKILKLQEEKKFYDKSTLAPTDVDILKNTASFLSLRLNDPNFQTLPNKMQENFKDVHRSFQTQWLGKTSLN